jgi:hypothetical protein
VILCLLAMDLAFWSDCHLERSEESMYFAGTGEMHRSFGGKKTPPQDDNTLPVNA